MNETNVKRRVMIAASAADCRLFNNPVGLLYTERGTPVRVGLFPGSSDLIGWRTIVVRPEHVGQRIAVFVAVETKRSNGGKRQDNQKTFIEAVRAAGGLAGFAPSVQDALAIIQGDAAAAAPNFKNGEGQ